MKYNSRQVVGSTDAGGVLAARAALSVRGAGAPADRSTSPTSSGATTPSSPAGSQVAAQSHDVSISDDSNDPEVLARRHNQILLDQHKQRMKSASYSATRRANMVHIVIIT